MKRSGTGDNIVQSTQTELAFFLVIVFVMLLGFEVAHDDLTGGIGDRSQGAPTSERFEAEVESDPQLSGEARAWSESADRALRLVKSCRVMRSPDQRSFVLPTDQVAGDDAESLTFGAGDDSISSDLWQNCLDELFQAVIATYQEQRESTRYAVIQGHTSSEWNVTAGCPGVPGASEEARQAIVAFKCNRLLSLKRADAIFEAGYFFNSIWHQNGVDQSLTPAEFATVFRTEGRSSLDLVRNGQGIEDKSRSRRVEFVFVAKSG